MKFYTIAFTKKGASLQQKVKSALYNNFCSDVKVEEFLSPRIYDELFGDEPSKIGRKSLDAFCELAWNEADGLLFIGATGIAVRGIAKYIVKKDKDPAVLVMDELGRFVIPLLSGHIGGANALAKRLAEDLGSTLVLTTATDINNKLAIDSWAVEKGFEIADTRGIAPIASAILEDRKVALIAPAKECAELAKKYPHFMLYEYGELNIERIRELLEETKDLPRALISPLTIEGDHLHIVPKQFFVGMGARRGKDSGEFIAFYEEMLSMHHIHRKAIYSINSIDLKADEQAFHDLYEQEKKDTKISLDFFKAKELEKAEHFTSHRFVPSKLVSSVTGVDNVCERAAVLALVKKLGEDHKAQVFVEKTKKDGMTMAVVACSSPC
ncbi:MAG: cobalamin biosynthesis protein [Peptostreptococcaceae bacterium]|nr:cobalamin biosynthesis protein [Peptostreptococcaceae bacterium]